ncbi:LysR family transcriptional regulator [bacterium]|nr:LysR family transcriptional regulator [bacterium]
MDVDALKLFVEVARSGSFAAVARGADIDPSQVSRAISGLESELGVRLLQRTTRAMSLTEAGARYLAQITPLIEGLDRAAEAARSEDSDPAGMVRLTASVAFAQACLAPLLGRFRGRFPKLVLDLVLTDRNLDLVADRIDIAIRLGPSYSADVIGARLFPTRYRVVAAPGWVARHGPLASPAELSGHDCLLFSFPDFRTRWLFRSGETIEEVPVRPALLVTNALILREAARAGHGPALLADWLIGDDLASGRLVDLFADHDVTATSFDTAAWLLYPSRTHMPARVRAVIDFLKREMTASVRM